MAIATYGTNAVDSEQRIDSDRLRSGRLARLRDHLEQSDLGALLAFDFSNIRYMSATYIGTCAVDKLIRFALITRYSDPIVWDVGSAARHHQLFNPWLSASTRAADVDADADPHAPHHGTPRPRLESGARAGISTLRGAINPDAEIAESVASKIRRELDRVGLAGEPLGVDVIELPVLAALQNAGITVVDGQQVFLEARRDQDRRRDHPAHRRRSHHPVRRRGSPGRRAPVLHSHGPLPASRWTESHMNTGYGEKVATAAESNGQPVR